MHRLTMTYYALNPVKNLEVETADYILRILYNFPFNHSDAIKQAEY